MFVTSFSCADIHIVISESRVYAGVLRSGFLVRLDVSRRSLHISTVALLFLLQCS